MSLALRLTGRRVLLTPSSWCGPLSPLTLRAMATMKPMSAEEHTISKTPFWAKNKALGRPISPHLSIYKPQITWIMSITHRITGVAQSGFIYGFALTTVISQVPFPVLLADIQSLHLAAPLIFLGKFGLSWAFSYHLWNGIRHLVWDMGMGFKIPEVYKTGHTVLALSVLSAAMLAFL